MSRVLTNKAKRLTVSRTKDRTAEIRKAATPINRVTRTLENRITDIVLANRGGPELMTAMSMRAVGQAIGQLEDVMRSEMRRLTDWSYASAGEMIVETLPLVYWVRRLLPVVPTITTESDINEQLSDIEAEQSILRIINQEVDRDEAKELVNEIVFPPPSEAAVARTMSATSANDGLSAWERVRTIETARAHEFRELLTRTFAGGFRGASAVEAMSKQLRQLCGNDPGKSTGMNYRARRIARTEGVRISEAGLRESWAEVGDVIEAIVWYSARVADTRPDHAGRHEKNYWRTSSGEFIARDGEVLPEIPLAPNCLCATSPRLAAEITQGLPQANLGAWYDDAALRAEKAALDARDSNRAARSEIQGRRRQLAQAT